MEHAAKRLSDEQRAGHDAEKDVMPAPITPCSAPWPMAAERLAAQSFLNAALREWPHWSLLDEDACAAHGLAGQMAIAFPIVSKDARILLPLRHHSPSGHHAFVLPALLDAAGGRAPVPLDFVALIALITGTIADGHHVAQEQRLLFLRRVIDSRRVTEQALAARWSGIEDLLTADLDFIAAEQALLGGHSFHPTPRLREGFTPEETGLHAPEFGGGFALRWFSVARSAVRGEVADGGDIGEVLRALAMADPVLPGATRAALCERHDRLPFPVHPWQAERLLRDPEVGALIAAGRIEDLGVGGASWRPTSSLRTLHAEHATHMLKFSLDLRITNSRRRLYPAELERGLHMHRLCESAIGQAMRARHPEWRVLTEPGHFSLIGQDGESIVASSVLLRENPFTAGAGPAELLASLCQPDPRGGRSRLGRIVAARAMREGLSEADTAVHWFDRFLVVAVAPFLTAEAEHGLLFGAHQQNLLLRLADGLPVAAYYRDCQGTGHRRDSEARLAAALADGIPTSAILLAPVTGHRLLAYYLIVNSVLGVIGTLGADGLAAESALAERLRVFLRWIRNEVSDAGFVDFLLTAPHLPAKANFLTCLRGIDENTGTGEQNATYVEIANPVTAAVGSTPALLPGQVRTGDAIHPQRPPAPRGLVYERFVPEIRQTLSFRALEPECDLDRFHRWMNDGRIAHFWELARPRAAIADYLARLEADPHIFALIGCFDGEPAGYFEVYWAKEDRLGACYDADDYDRGWHGLIGERHHLGRAKTLAWMRGLTHYLFLDEPRTAKVVGEPRASNIKILRYADALAYEKVKEFDFPHKRAALMQCHRDRFFATVLR